MADAKFEVRDASGNLILSLGSRTLRLLTTFDVTGNGSATIPSPVNGTVEFYQEPIADIKAEGTSFSVSGQTVSWVHSGDGGGASAVLVR